MIWKEKFVKVIDETLNKDGVGVYHVNLIDDDSFEIWRYDHRLILTKCAQDHLFSAHWKQYARNAVIAVTRKQFSC